MGMWYGYVFFFFKDAINLLFGLEMLFNMIGKELVDDKNCLNIIVQNFNII